MKWWVLTGINMVLLVGLALVVRSNRQLRRRVDRNREYIDRMLDKLRDRD